MAGSEVIGGFTPGELQFASWWVRNRLALERGVRTALILLSIVLYGYAAWGLLDAFVISYPRESLITSGIKRNLELLSGLESDRPQGERIGDIAVFGTTDGRVDMLAQLENPNAQWWGEFNYQFDLAGEETPLRTGYLLPGSPFLATELGYKPRTPGARSADLIIKNMRWQRVDPKILASGYQTYRDERLDLAIEDVRYDADTKIDTKTVGRTSFTVVNKGAFGFWSVDLIVRLMRAGNTAAVTKITITNLTPAERRPITITWVDNPPSVQETIITPQVNVLVPGNFLPTRYFK